MLVFKPERFNLGEYNSHPISVCGKSFVADMSGALFWPGEKTLIISDLHFEKGSAHAAKGQMLPPYDTRETLLRLASVLDKYDPDTVVALGDSFHDAEAFDRMAEEDRKILALIQDDRRWIWVTGNHDPEIPRTAGGEVMSSFKAGGLHFVHEPSLAQTTHEIAGHLHPAARLSVYGYSIRRPCFIANKRRLVVPAFGSFTGGLNILDDAFLPLFGQDGFAVWMLGEEGLYPVATRLLLPDRG